MNGDDEIKPVESATISREQTLLVPVCLEAMVVGEGHTTPPTSWTDQTPDYGRIGKDGLGRGIVPSLFKEQEKPPAGVHLHWALPAALTHGTQGQGTATAIIAGGVVSDIRITEGGSGYTRPPRVTFAGGDGSGARAAALIKDGVLFKIQITNGGRGYTAPPAVDIEPSDDLAYPLVPNRWLVQRITGEPGTEDIPAMAWIVESDYLDPAKGANSWVMRDKGATTYGVTRLGRTIAYADWAETGGALFLTALGPGNPAFAASYQACRGVFGFHDDMGGLPSGLYTYMVAGWYADPGKDPLHGLDSAEGWHRRMQDLQWSVPEETTLLPIRTLCHGMIHSVDWQGPQGAYRSGVPQSQAAVAVGNTPTEALATLIHAGTPETGKEGVARLLGKFQYGVLKKNKLETIRMVRDEAQEGRPPDHFAGMFAGVFAGVKEGIHQKGFGTKPGGTFWDIQKKERSEAFSEGNDTRPTNPFPSRLADLLTQINQKQRDFDAKERQFTELQWQLYANWYKASYLRKLRIGTKEEKEKIEKTISETITLLKKTLTDIQADMNMLKDVLREYSIPDIQEKIEDELRRCKDREEYAWLKDYHLVETAMPFFYRAYEPVILLHGVEPSAKYGKPGPSEKLACRVSDQTVVGLRGLEVEGYGEVNVEKRDLESYYTLPEENEAARLPRGIEALFVESLFLDPGRAALIARAAYALNGIKNPTTAQVERLRQPIAEAQESRAAAQFGQTRLPAGSAVSAWKPAWTPLFMAWEVNWSPYYRSPERQEVPERIPDEQQVRHYWDFSSNIDYTWQSAPPETASETLISYKGYVPLSPHASQDLEEARKKFPDIPLLFDALHDVRLLSQSLSGLYDAMIMREPALQFPPLKEGRLEIDEEILGMVGEQYAMIPMPDSPGGNVSTFSPIRGGHLSLKRLWVVDTFGQVMKVVDDGRGAPIHVSQTLATPWDPRLIHFPPRLAQPARLKFRWRSAQNDGLESSTDAASQPICGWVLPNRLDRSLVVYDAQGNELGALQLIDDPLGWRGKRIRWSSLPLGPLDREMPGGGESKPTSADIPNPHLLKFVQGLLNLADDEGRAQDDSLSDFLDLLEDMVHTIHPSAELQQQSLSVVVGRPLALIRASLQLELDGPPAVDLGWHQSGKRNHQGFTRVTFPVHLGDMRKGRDGLIGYFSEDDYRTIRLSFGTPGPTNRYFERDRDIDLTCDPAAEPVMVTLLMDPQGGVHISSGILPVKFITLPPWGVSDALAAMDITLLTAPVIGRAETPGIPLPRDIPGDWFWISRTADGTPEAVPLEEDKAKAPSLFGPMQIHEGWLKLRRALKVKPETEK